MDKLLAVLGAVVGGWVGWWAGQETVGTMTAYFLSVIGTALGLYLGRRIAREHF